MSVLAMGCGLAAIVEGVLAVTFDPRCSSVKFEPFHLACERV
jgi:hypothetical protein